MKVTSVRTVVAILVLSAVLAGHVCAQSGASVRVTAEAEPMEVGTEETVVFTVRVQGAPATVVQTPDRPAVTNLAPQQRTPSTQRALSSGEDASRGVTFTWRFRPRREGTARIRPVTVIVRGETYTTEEIRLQVVPQSQRSSSPTLTRLGPPSSPPGNEDAILDARDLFIRATATADWAYQNEQVVVEYRLFYRPGIRLRHSRLADAWDAPGFWREELNVASRPTPRTRRAYGQAYETIVLKRVALFPTRPGTLHVDPLRVETEAQGTLQMRGGAVRARFVPIRLASEGLSLPVRALPPTAPASFEGAVGQFAMTVGTEADSATVGTPVRLRVQVRGSGNLATLSPPRLDVPSEFEVYEPAVRTDIDRSGDRIDGTKTFAYTLVPRASGRYTLPPATFAYFNPEAERYETLRSETKILHVTGEAAPWSRPLSGQTGDGLPVGDVTGLMETEEARWVRTDRPPLYRQPWAYVVLLIPVLLAAGGLIYRRRTRTSEPKRSADRDEALDTGRDRLREAHRHLQDGADSAFYEAVEQGLRAVLSARLGLNGSGVTRVALDRHLARHDVPEDLRDALCELLDRCGEAQFAPESPSSASMEAVLDEAETVLRRLDEHLPPAPETNARSGIR